MQLEQNRCDSNAFPRWSAPQLLTALQFSDAAATVHHHIDTTTRYGRAEWSVRTGLGLIRSGVICRDQLKLAHAESVRRDASGRQDGVTAQCTAKTDSKNSKLIELGSRAE